MYLFLQQLVCGIAEEGSNKLGQRQMEEKLAFMCIA